MNNADQASQAPQPQVTVPQDRIPTPPEVLADARDDVTVEYAAGRVIQPRPSQPTQQQPVAAFDVQAVYDEMARRIPNWNAYGNSRGGAVAFALRIASELYAAPPQAGQPEPTWKPPTSWEIIHTAEDFGMPDITVPYLSDGDKKISDGGKLLVRVVKAVLERYVQVAQRAAKAADCGPKPADDGDESAGQVPPQVPQVVVPLPEPRTLGWNTGGMCEPDEAIVGFTFDQMREYGNACRADERQRTLAAEWEAADLRGKLGAAGQVPQPLSDERIGEILAEIRPRDRR